MKKLQSFLLLCFWVFIVMPCLGFVLRWVTTH